MSGITNRLITVVLVAGFVTSVAWTAPIPKPAPPSNLTGKELTFLKLNGVDSRTGTFSKPFPITITEYRTEVRERAVTRQIQGRQVTENVPYTVQVPVSRTVIQTFDTKSHEVYDGTGQLIPAEKAFDRLVNGQVVLVCLKPELPKAYIQMLSPKAIILVPKRKPGEK